MTPPNRPRRIVDPAVDAITVLPPAGASVEVSAPLAAAELGGRQARRFEAILWIAVAAIAIALRLINLDGNPLQPTEATLAMDSWRILRGLGIDVGSAPLLIYGNAVLFFALGPTDAVARALPMAVGSAVALSPLFLRRPLGRAGSLAAALILATSPTLIFASRSVDGAMIATGAGLALALLLARYLELRRPGDLALAGGAAAFLLLSGPSAYVVLLAFLSFALVYAWEWLDRSSPKRGFSANAVGRSDPFFPPAPSFEALLRSSADWRRFTIALALTFVVVATGLGSHLPGFGIALAVPLEQWAAGLGAFWSAPLTLFPSILIAYEPFTLAAGSIGILLALRTERLFLKFLAWWAVAGLVCLILSGGGTPMWAATIIVPLALLGGYALDHLPRLLRSPERRRALAFGGPLFLSLSVTTLIVLGNVTLTVPNVPAWTVALPPLAMLCLIGFFAGWYNARVTATVVGAAGALGLLILQIHAALLLNPGRPLNPGELFTGVVTSPDLRTLASQVALIQDEYIIAQKNEGRPVTDEIQIMAPRADLVAWYLHGRSSVRVVTAIDGSPSIAIVGPADPAPKGIYAGQVFQFTIATGPRASTLGELGRWWLYHQGPTVETTNLKVFVKKRP